MNTLIGNAVLFTIPLFLRPQLVHCAFFFGVTLSMFLSFMCVIYNHVHVHAVMISVSRSIQHGHELIHI